MPVPTKKAVQETNVCEHIFLKYSTTLKCPPSMLPDLAYMSTRRQLLPTMSIRLTTTSNDLLHEHAIAFFKCHYAVACLQKTKRKSQDLWLHTSLLHLSEIELHCLFSPVSSSLSVAFRVYQLRSGEKSIGLQ